MDFTKLSTAELTDFLQLYSVPLPTSIPEKITLASQIFSQYGHRGIYTLPVVDLYLSGLITPDNQRYKYYDLLISNLAALAPLLSIFHLPVIEASRYRLINILRLAQLIDYDENFWNRLPPELQKIILNKIPDNYISAICHSFFTICQDEDFWHTRYLLYFGTEPVNPRFIHLSWRSIYYHYGLGNSYTVPLHDGHNRRLRVFTNETLGELAEDVSRIPFFFDLGNQVAILVTRNDGSLVASRVTDFSPLKIDRIYNLFILSKQIQNNIVTKADNIPIPDIGVGIYFKN